MPIADQAVTNVPTAVLRTPDCGMVGPNAGDLVAEAALAVEMGADATDLGATVHPRPTLSQTVDMAAEMFKGTITDLIPPKKKP
jgi:dihydrolipoamide dehydrogenase